MAFGNPYGEVWNEEIVAKWGEKLAGLGVKTLALADTIGVSNADNIIRLFSTLIPAFPEVEWGALTYYTRYLERKSRSGLQQWLHSI